MNDKTKERWLQLCEQAAVEQNPERLLKLVNEIVRMLDEKNERMQPASPPDTSRTTALPTDGHPHS
jgi:hypothetical protein